jgi:acyl-CoA synthetase (AMP-forming)/AMP-acid ligase II
MIQAYKNSGTVWERWKENARLYPDRHAVIHWVAGEEPYRWTFSGLLEAAEVVAANLMNRDIGPDQVCAIILRHNKFLYPLYFGISLIGALPAILAYPNPRLHPDKFRQGIEGMSRRSGLDWIFTERDLEPKIRPLIDHKNCTIRGLHFPLEWDPAAILEGAALDTLNSIHRTVSGARPFLLQHSSGTTGLQKPVLLSHQAVLEHVKCYSDAIGLTESDKIASWLPLYHDMGLIAAFHVPLIAGIPTIHIDPFEWVQVPSLLLEAVSNERGTLSWLPNFALNMMADKITDEQLEGIDLGSWRMVVNCSEPIRHDSNDKFMSRFEPYGLRTSALACSYAMAETTFAVTQTPLEREPVVLSVDRKELSRNRVRLAAPGDDIRLCVSSGQLISGCSVRIVDEHRKDLPEWTVGEIAVRSVSMFDGYRNYPDKTADVMQDHWYYTGDYAFTIDGEYYVIGRKKDMIIVAGSNIYPEDVEDVVGTVEGVIRGRVVAFGEEAESVGSERVAVVVESNVQGERERKAQRLEIIKAGMSVDVSIATVYIVPPRWLIKSSAGKPSRKANRERILAGADCEVMRT